MIGTLRYDNKQKNPGEIVFMDFTQILLISYLALFKWSSNYLSDNYFFLFKSKTPLQATGYQICSAASSGVFDPRGSRQISMQAWLLGSLLAGIKQIIQKIFRIFVSENLKKLPHPL